MTASCRLANAPASWGVDFADQPGIPGWDAVLDGIRDAGFQHVELGPYGYLPPDVEQLREALAARGLEAAGGLLYEPFHDPDAHEEIGALAEKVCAWIAGAGGTYLLLVPMVTADRSPLAGRASGAPALAEGTLASMAAFLRRLAELAGEHGLVAALHPHAGTHVETRDEIAAAIEAIASPQLRLCIDTGHSLYAGIDPTALLQEYRELVVGFHLKDLSREALASSLAAGHDFDEAVSAGVFRPLGIGDVDFEAFAAALGATGESWWATVEQDVDPLEPGDPVRDAAASRRYLESVGLGDRAGVEQR